MSNQHASSSENQNTPMSGFFRGLAVSVGVGVCLLLLARTIWSEPTAQAIAKERSTKVKAKIESGTEAFQKGDHLTARTEFIAARDLVIQARIDARAAYDAANPKKGAPTIISPRTIDMDPQLRKLEAEVRYRLAAVLLSALRKTYAAELTRAGEIGMKPFIPPRVETTPIEQEISAGLAAEADNKYLYFLSGQLNTLMGRRVAAVRSLERAIKIDSQFAKAYNELGRAYMAPIFFRADDGDRYQEKALANFRLARSISQEQGRPLSDALYNLGLLYDRISLLHVKNSKPFIENREEAIVHFKKYLKEVGKEKRPPPNSVQIARDRLAKSSGE